MWVDCFMTPSTLADGSQSALLILISCAVFGVSTNIAVFLVFRFFAGAGAFMILAAVPLWMAAAYAASNITLNSLNWYWFGKMIETIRKRFPPPLGTMKVEKKKEKEGIDVARGVYADGHKSLEINSTEVRKRPAAQRLQSEQVIIP